MPLRLDNLDATTRQHMLAEVAHDVKSNTLYISPRLNDAGRAIWHDLLCEAIERHDSAWLSDSLRSRSCFAATKQRRKPTGGYTNANIPVTAPETLAEGEFNRFYIRGLCQRVLQSGSGRLVIYRAKQVSSPRPESEALIGTIIDPQRILNDLRNSTGTDTVFGLPSGPNSGLSVRFM